MTTNFQLISYQKFITMSLCPFCRYWLLFHSKMMKLNKYIHFLIKICGLMPFTLKNNKFQKSSLELGYSYFILILVTTFSLMSLYIKENYYEVAVNIVDYSSVSYSVFIKCLNIMNAIIYKDDVRKYQIRFWLYVYMRIILDNTLLEWNFISWHRVKKNVLSKNFSKTKISFEIFYWDIIFDKFIIYCN